MVIFKFENKTLKNKGTYLQIAMIVLCARMVIKYMYNDNSD